ncbi:XRE family transcriptional regulator [Salmonella enterica subsp. enterica serovar Oranienburg]|uniref:XRE family transcriptional regulator n=1 Tax=Salmonella diarizonae TaxID=59204 RepID=A0A5Y1YDJ6_SALDZ|nr:XRE family transcriptional regulator [Salmonella enterica subsp. enterica serovar Oranienburg]ECC3916792.1 XRE family transcriptional regulator [Salmonella enterica subsp. diarizonae]EHN1697883.1 XRE family transcriptional regulator [Salmonella enterica subsp. enterica serovar Newport]EIU9113062.1 XRE family transcriptional regulator [Salmonella enterica]EEH0186478.1 XRE family transcriptional regulator [Salmonella enterica subsp. enterica serovar Oranienburg]
MKMNNTPENIKKLRNKMGITQTECGEIFGVSLRTWQKKEEAKTHNRLNLSKGEFEYLLLLAGEHPDYILCKRGAR